MIDRGSCLAVAQIHTTIMKTVLLLNTMAPLICAYRVEDTRGLPPTTMSLRAPTIGRPALGPWRVSNLKSRSLSGNDMKEQVESSMLSTTRRQFGPNHSQPDASVRCDFAATNVSHRDLFDHNFSRRLGTMGGQFLVIIDCDFLRVGQRNPCR